MSYDFQLWKSFNGKIPTGCVKRILFYRSQLFFHGKNMESLHKHIDPKYLPKEYNGIRPNYPYQHWFINLKNNSAVVKGKPFNVNIQYETKPAIARVT